MTCRIATSAQVDNFELQFFSMSFLNRIIRFFLKIISKDLISVLQDTPFLYGQNSIQIGEKVKLSNVILNSRSGQIIIENGVFFGHNCMVLTGIHDYQNLEGKRSTMESAGRDILIGENTWIASGVTIVGPVKIGRNSVVGAGSVVVSDLPEAVLAVGNPAKVVKKLNENKA